LVSSLNSAIFEPLSSPGIRVLLPPTMSTYFPPSMTVVDVLIITFYSNPYIDLKMNGT